MVLLICIHPNNRIGIEKYFRLDGVTLFNLMYAVNNGNSGSKVLEKIGEIY